VILFLAFPRGYPISAQALLVLVVVLANRAPMAHPECPVSMPGNCNIPMAAPQTIFSYRPL